MDDILKHKRKVVLFLLLMGVTILFTALCVAYIYSKTYAGFKGLTLPFLFYFNSIFMLLSSGFLIRAQTGLRQQLFAKLRINLLLSTLSTVLFLGLQIVAWMQLFANNVLPTDGQNAAYLYLISIVHFLHVVGGIFYLLHILVPLLRPESSVQRNKALLNPILSEKVWVISVYTHYLDLMWIVLVLFFVFNMMRPLH